MYIFVWGFGPFGVQRWNEDEGRAVLRCVPVSGDHTSTEMNISWRPSSLHHSRLSRLKTFSIIYGQRRIQPAHIWTCKVGLTAGPQLKETLQHPSAEKHRLCSSYSFTLFVQKWVFVSECSHHEPSAIFILKAVTQLCDSVCCGSFKQRLSDSACTYILMGRCFHSRPHYISWRRRASKSMRQTPSQANVQHLQFPQSVLCTTSVYFWIRMAWLLQRRN